MGFPLCDPGVGYFQDDINGDNSPIATTDAFVAGFRISNGALAWSTFVGGSSGDDGRVIEVNKATGSIMMAGYTHYPVYSVNQCVPPEDSGFPSCGTSLQQFGGGSGDIFVVRFGAADLDLKWSTFIGGGGSEEVTSLRHRFGGQMLLSGWTNSGSDGTSPFPTLQLSNVYFKGTHNDAGSSAETQDAVIMVLDETGGDHLKMSTYLGGSGNDVARVAVATDESRIYVAGTSTSTANIPFKCPPTDNPYCYLAYTTVTPSNSDVLYAQIVDDITIGIEQTSLEDGSDQGFVIYPNPATDSYFIELDDQLRHGGLPHLELLDAMGRLVQVPSLQRTGDDRLHCTLGTIAHGAYVVRMSSADASWTKTTKLLVR